MVNVPMKILILGDMHGEIEIAKRIVDSTDCDYVLQVGDMTLYGNYSKPVYFITGNHENWDIIEAIDNGKIEFENLKHINTAEVISLKKGKEIIGVSGLNGNYSPKDYELKRQELEGKRRSHFVKDDVERCKKLKNIDIFLSHEPPVGIGFIKRNKDVGIEPIKEILDSIRPRFLFFCHHHIFFEKTVNITRIFGLSYASREYCILDTNRNKVKRIQLGVDYDAKL